MLRKSSPKVIRRLDYFIYLKKARSFHRGSGKAVEHVAEAPVASHSPPRDPAAPLRLLRRCRSDFYALRNSMRIWL